MAQYHGSHLRTTTYNSRVTAPARELLDDCVHCGFCLPTCPTYLLWGQETDSPRGRIHLMKLRRDGRESNPQSFVQHIDTCLGCMACVTACPSGVQYDSLLEAARPEVERIAHRGLGDRLFRRAIFEMFPHPGRLRWMAWPLGVYQNSGSADARAQIGPDEAVSRAAAGHGAAAAADLV